MDDKPGRTFLTIAGINGALAISIGAFGAHGLSEIIGQVGKIEIWKTASLYHLVHSVVLLIAALAIPLGVVGRGVAGSFWCWLGGVFIFAGTLYAIALGAPAWLGAITPLGGLLMIAGWLCICFWKKPINT